MHGLGDLESSTMQILWDRTEPATVREVLGELNETRNLAYTTVMTVLDNLHRKGWVTRHSQGRAYLYRAAESRAEAAARALRELLDSTGDPDGALLHFARSASEHELDLLRRGLDRRHP